MKNASIITVLLLVLTSCVAKSQSTLPYTKEDILKDLEDLQPYKQFFSLEHPYIHTAGSRITLFADSTRWAIVFEKSGYYEGGELELTYFGNCLTNQKKLGLYSQYLCNFESFGLITTKELARINAQPDTTFFELVSKDAKQIKVRDSFLIIEHDINRYKQKGIKIQDYHNPNNLIDFPSLIRCLVEENPLLFRATEKELRTLLPTDLPKLFVINQWHHKEYYVFPDGVHEPYGDKPSSYETFQLIADILVSKDTTRWKPKLKPNNDWRNWPRSGSM